jgi:hypothetical protein
VELDDGREGIVTGSVGGHMLDPRVPLHKFVVNRIRNDRDVFIVITAKDSDRGVGKTTLALYLCMGYTRWLAGHDWWCDPEQPDRGMATVDPGEFFKIVDRMGDDYDPGTAIFLDEAEELTGRRAMAKENVEFIQRMQMMRKKQAITILALPDPGALDPGIERLADVWLNVTKRGTAVVHKNGVKSYGSRDITTKRAHKFDFPDVSHHDQMANLDKMKDNKMDEWAEDGEQESTPDPEEVRRESLEEVAQQMRDNGASLREVADNIPRGRSWISNHTTAPD